MFINSIRYSKKCLKRMLWYILPSSTVLMFHHIDDGNIIRKSGCSLSKEKFISILDSGITFCTLEEYCKFTYSYKNPCVITFDDGLSDIYKVAYPELKKRGIPFTVFIITDLLGTEGYITIEELKELAINPLVTIASHGLTHDILKGLDIEKQKKELIQSKTRLEELCGREIKCFAYSHGQYDEKTLDILNKEKCYEYAFVAGGGVTNIITKNNNYTLPRLNCEDNLYNFSIKNKLGAKCLMLNI